MNLAVRGNKIEIDQHVEDYVKKKIESLNRILPSVLEAKVEISKERAKSPKNRYIVQITINTNGTLIRAEEKEADLYAAIDAAADVMRRQARRFKDRFYLKHRRTARQKREQIPSVEAVGESGDPGRIVRTKRFALKVMTVHEAAEQMELLGHDFFVFLNADNKSLNILYRRKDKDYGLIEPEVM